MGNYQEGIAIGELLVLPLLEGEAALLELLRRGRSLQIPERLARQRGDDHGDVVLSVLETLEIAALAEARRCRGPHPQANQQHRLDGLRRPRDREQNRKGTHDSQASKS